MATILPPNHPEADRPSLQEYTMDQLAELASVESEEAGRLALEYAKASTLSDAEQIGMRIEEARGSAEGKLS